MSDTNASPHILVVGAGAVGQAYGYHLHKGGAKVGFLVKPTHRNELQQGGLVLHRHRLFRRPRSHRFDDFEVYCDYDELAKHRWDQVWLCVSGPALAGPWLPDLVGRIGQATLVSLQSGLKGRRIAEVYEPAKTVFGQITLIGYQAPLAGEQLSAGIAYLLPPMAPVPFSGPAGRVEAVVDALDGGGCPATIDQDTPTLASFGTATMLPAVAGLEVAGWSLEGYRKSAALEISTAAAKEALRIMGVYHFSEVPRAARFIRRPEILGSGLAMAPALLPFDLEIYLKYHFTKVGDQTRQVIDEFIRLGDGQQNRTRALRVLRRLLEGRQPAASAQPVGAAAQT